VVVVDPPDGKIPAQTAEARQRAARLQTARRGRGQADSWEDRSLYDRCITRGLPGSMMPAIYGNSYRIVQASGYVVIQYEMVHESRVIPLDDRPAIGGVIRSHMGDGRGHWEGDTLVVETTNFRQESVYRGANPDTLRITERFTRVSPDRLDWRFTVNDPSTWTKPWTFAMPLTRSTDEDIVEYACHEGNRAMANILSAARAEEKAVAERANTNTLGTGREDQRSGHVGLDGRPSPAPGQGDPLLRRQLLPLSANALVVLQHASVVAYERRVKGNHGGERVAEGRARRHRCRELPADRRLRVDDMGAISGRELHGRHPRPSPGSNRVRALLRRARGGSAAHRVLGHQIVRGNHCGNARHGGRTRRACDRCALCARN
jgi:hypothetical protein